MQTNVGDGNFYVFGGPFNCEFIFFFIFDDYGVCSNFLYRFFFLVQ